MNSTAVEDRKIERKSNFPESEPSHPPAYTWICVSRGMMSLMADVLKKHQRSLKF